jgi:hypothetical protein
MATPTQISGISVAFANAAALATWLTNLATDVTNGKVSGFELSTEKTSGIITGILVIPTPVDHTAALEDE